MRCIATVKRTLKRGLKDTQNASELLGAASYLPTAELLAQASGDKLIDRRQAFGAPAPAADLKSQISNLKSEMSDPQDHPSTGSVEYTMTRLGSRRRTASDIADAWEAADGQVGGKSEV